MTPLRERIEALRAALAVADVTGALDLKGVTPEDLARAFPEAETETYVNNGGASSGRPFALDLAALRFAGVRVTATRHREPTADELAEAETAATHQHVGSFHRPLKVAR